MKVVLSPHPCTPAAFSLRLHAAAERTSGGELSLRYVLEAPLAQIRVPQRSERPSHRDLLWQHTCFEAFVGLAPGGPYHELNLSPSGDWAAYAFRAYREPAPAREPGPVPAILTSAAGECLLLAARVPLAGLSAAYAEEPIHLALSAVIEAESGELSYFALCHPGEKPDFHHAGSFTLRLDPPA